MLQPTPLIREARPALVESHSRLHFVAHRKPVTTPPSYNTLDQGKQTSGELLIAAHSAITVAKPDTFTAAARTYS